MNFPDQTGKRVLITGGLGFIGSNLARRLARSGADVTVVDSLVPEYGGNLHNVRDLHGKIRVNISDMRDEHSLRYFAQQQDLIYNLAGQTSHMDSMENPWVDLAINCEAQLSLLEICRRVNPGVRIVFASTRQLYGVPQYLPVDENHPLQPADVNGINKLAGENYHRLYHTVYGIPTCILRFTNTIGPGMRVKDARQTFLGIWIRKVLQGDAIEVWGGSQLRDFTYVDDAVNALLLAASASAAGCVFNLGGSPPISLAALAHLLIEVAGQGSVVEKEYPAERKKIDIGDYYASYDRITTALGWRPEIDLREALSRTVAFYRAELPHYL